MLLNGAPFKHNLNYLMNLECDFWTRPPVTLTPQPPKSIGILVSPGAAHAWSLRHVGEFPVELSCGMQFLDTMSCDFDLVTPKSIRIRVSPGVVHTWSLRPVGEFPLELSCGMRFWTRPPVTLKYKSSPHWESICEVWALSLVENPFSSF